jgi:hypothetical protein
MKTFINCILLIGLFSILHGQQPKLSELELPTSYGGIHSKGSDSHFKPGIDGPGYEFAKYRLSSDQEGQPIWSLTYSVINTDNESPITWLNGLNAIYSEGKYARYHELVTLDGRQVLLVLGNPDPFEDMVGLSSIAYIAMHERIYCLHFEKFGSIEKVKPFPLDKSYVRNLAWAFITMNK